MLHRLSPDTFPLGNYGLCQVMGVSEYPDSMSTHPLVPIWNVMANQS